MKVDLDKLEPEFYTTGWGGRAFGPEVFRLKLNDATTHQKLNYAGSEAYMGAETIMASGCAVRSAPACPVFRPRPWIK